MISMPIDQAIEKIKASTNLSTEEINKKITEKLDQLSGLVSKEGAAYIIANELGVKLFEQTSGKLQIKNILTGMRDVETVGKLTKKYDIREFTRKDGNSSKVGSFFIADETSSIRIVCWGSKADELNKMTEDDIVQIKSGYIRENNGQKEVHMNDNSKIILNPEGITINAIATSSNQTVNATRITIKELTESSNNVELFGTIVQTFEPKFFEVCPECNKRTKLVDGNYACPEHKSIVPTYSYVMNIVLDDGTETVRLVFFRTTVEQLLNKSRDEVLVYKSNPQDFEIIKNDLLGKPIIVSGKATKNQMFDRIEFITNSVNINPDPKAEINKLEKEL
jgi:ssDNA-binding replication factor A large subunit